MKDAASGVKDAVIEKTDEMRGIGGAVREEVNSAGGELSNMYSSTKTAVSDGMDNIKSNALESSDEMRGIAQGVPVNETEMYEGMPPLEDIPDVDTNVDTRIAEPTDDDLDDGEEMEQGTNRAAPTQDDINVREGKTSNRTMFDENVDERVNTAADKVRAADALPKPEAKPFNSNPKGF